MRMDVNHDTVLHKGDPGLIDVDKARRILIAAEVIAALHASEKLLRKRAFERLCGDFEIEAMRQPRTQHSDTK